MARRVKRRVTSDRRQREHKSNFDRTAIQIPEDFEEFEIDKAGVYKFDLLPYVVGKGNPFADEGELHYERTYYVHRGIGANQESYVCSAKSWGKKCFICEHRTELSRDPEADEDLIKSIAPKERQLWLLLDLTDPERPVKIWDISYYLFGKQLDTRIKNADEDDDWGVFADLEEGLTLKVAFDEENAGKFTWFSASSIDFKKRKPYDEDILERTCCLDDLLIETAYEKLKAIFLQSGEEEEQEEKSTTLRKGSQSELDLVQDEKEEKEEKEEDTKTTKKKRGRPRKTPEPEPEPEPESKDDDWGDEDDDWNEDDIPFDDKPKVGAKKR